MKKRIYFAVNMNTILKQIALACFVCCAVSCTEQKAEPVNKPTESKMVNTLVEHENEDTFEELVKDYESEDRVNWQKPDLVIEKLQPLAEKTLVDLGSGTGYFTYRFLPLVDRLIAVDIDPRMVEFMNKSRAQIPQEFDKKLDIRLATADDSKINDNEADIIFLTNTYRFIENRLRYFSNLKRKLKKGGRVVIVEFKMKNIPIGPNKNEKVALFEAEEELLKAGYKIIDSDDRTLPFQYILIVEKL